MVIIYKVHSKKKAGNGKYYRRMSYITKAGVSKHGVKKKVDADGELYTKFAKEHAIYARDKKEALRELRRYRSENRASLSPNRTIKHRKKRRNNNSD